MEVKFAIFCLINFTLAGLLQTRWLKKRYLKGLMRPLDFGIHVFGRPLFGENKTIYGFVGMPFFCGASFFATGIYWKNFIEHEPLLKTHELVRKLPVLPVEFFMFGILCGLVYMCGELPNSFLKRQLGIAPGGAPRFRVLKPVFYVFDQLDSVFCVVVFLCVQYSLGLVFLVTCLASGFFIHGLFNVLLWKLGMKERPI